MKMFKLLCMSVLVMLALAIVAMPAIACDDCRAGPGIVAMVDMDLSPVDVAAATVRIDTILVAQSELSGVLLAVVTNDPTEAFVFALVPRARDTPRYLFSGLHVADVLDTNRSGLTNEGTLTAYSKGSSLASQSVIA